MNLSMFLTVFCAVFVAELGDKTQLATLLFSSEANHSPWLIFAAASLALAASTAVAVLLGMLASNYLAVFPLKLLAGIGFLLIGSWTLWEYFR